MACPRWRPLARSSAGVWRLEQCLPAFSPLGDGSRHSDAVMTNLIGAEAEEWHRLAASGAALHLYGKAEARPGRKMGHVTRISPKPA